MAEQGGVEEIAGKVAGERSSRPIGAVQAGRQADNFIELEELKPQIAREGGPRSAATSPHYAQSA